VRANQVVERDGEKVLLRIEGKTSSWKTIAKAIL
jgi:hypothetical protein